MDAALQALISTARSTRSHAYCPYSRYAVGAAVEDAEGRIFSGCNLENVSFGVTICAERAAIAKMVSEGGQRIRRIVVATSDGAFPCGLCLQTLLEFKSNSLEVFIIDDADQLHSYRLRELLPHAFDRFSRS